MFTQTYSTVHLAALLMSTHFRLKDIEMLECHGQYLALTPG